MSLPGPTVMRSGGTAAGDFSEAPPGAVTWLRQVHGRDVAVVRAPGDRAGGAGDGAVTDVPGAVLCVRTADCAPVGLGSAQGVAGLAHAGWKGLVAGVVEATVGAMRDLGAEQISAAVGPCIGVHAYEFSEPDLERVAGLYGPDVVGRTLAGRPALDLRAAVEAALTACGVENVEISGTCTHCSPDHWSWRARRDSGRQGTFVWLDSGLYR